MSQQKRPITETKKVRNSINMETAMVSSAGTLKKENINKRVMSRDPKPAIEIGKNVTKEAMAKAEEK